MCLHQIAASSIGLPTGEVRMDQEILLRLRIEIESLESRPRSEPRNSNLAYLDLLLESLALLIRESDWPESEQGEFVAFLANDVYEFGSAIRCEIAADRWTAATALNRPLKERAEYALAAAIDPEFWNLYRERMTKQIDRGFKGRSRNLIGTARGIIDRWARESKGVEGTRISSTNSYRISSEILHQGIGLTREANRSSDNRDLFVTNCCIGVRIAVMLVVLATEIIGVHATEGLRIAKSTAFLAEAQQNTSS